MHATMVPMANGVPGRKMYVEGPRILRAVVGRWGRLGWKLVAVARWTLDGASCRTLCFNRGDERLNVYVTLDR